jgi:hypothetical protein
MSSDNNNSFLSQSGDPHYEPLPDEQGESQFYDMHYHNAFFNKLEDNSVPLIEIDENKEKEMIKNCENNIEIAKDLEKCNGEIIKLNSKSKAMKILDKNISARSKLAQRRNIKAKAFQFTLNEVERYEKLKNYLMGLKNLRYFIACKEIAPSTGHEHIHIYAQFSKQSDISYSKCEGAHIEKCYGTPEENKKYIEKDGNIIDEWGELGSNTNTQFPTIAEVKKMSDEEMDQCPLQYYNQIQKIKTERANNMDVHNLAKVVKVFYLWGPSGCGKTSYAKLAIAKLGFEFNQVKYENTFWSGLNENCKVALYDDWRDSDMKPNEFIKFIDYNRHSLNIKYGQVRNNYEYIFITSIQDPDKIYWESSKKNEEQIRQWIRRMEIIHIPDKYTVDEIIKKYVEVFGEQRDKDFDINNII